MDNLDSLLLELEKKEKNQQQTSKEGERKPKEEPQKTSVIEQQKAEIERLRAQLAGHHLNSNSGVNLDLTGDVITSKPSPKISTQSLSPEDLELARLREEYEEEQRKMKRQEAERLKRDIERMRAINNGSNANTYATNNNNVNNNNVNNNNVNYNNNNVNNNNVNNNNNNVNNNKNLNSSTKPIPTYNSVNSSNNNNNNNNNNNINNNNVKESPKTPIASPQEKELLAEIEQMKQELGNSTEREKAKLIELERMRDILKQQLSSIKTSPVKVDPANEKRLAELERKKQELQRELSSSPSKAALVQEHEKNKKELNDIQFGVDVCFLMDCTGSMQSFLLAAKENIQEVVNEVKVIDPRAVLRFAFVGYRDFDDKVQHERLDFIPSERLYEFEKMVGSIIADGGGDIPEDVAGGLLICTQLNWTASTRLLIHIADAPCHGIKYHQLGAKKDDYPTGDPNGLVPEDLLKKLLSLRVDYYFLSITKHTDLMVTLFKKVYVAAKKTFEKHPVGSDPKKFLPKVVASIHSSMAQSVQFKNSPTPQLMALRK